MSFSRFFSFWKNLSKLFSSTVYSFLPILYFQFKWQILVRSRFASISRFFCFFFSSIWIKLRFHFLDLVNLTAYGTRCTNSMRFQPLNQAACLFLWKIFQFLLRWSNLTCLPVDVLVEDIAIGAAGVSILQAIEWKIVANSPPPLRRFCVVQALGRGDWFRHSLHVSA